MAKAIRLADCEGLDMQRGLSQADIPAGPVERVNIFSLIDEWVVAFIFRTLLAEFFVLLSFLDSKANTYCN